MAHQTKAQKAKAATRVLPEEDPEFQIAPMIDILLVLLIFFMSIATDQVLAVSKEVVLPVAKKAEEFKPDDTTGELLVNLVWNEISNTGAIKIGDATIEPPMLAEMIRRKKELNPAAFDSGKFRIIIRADKNVKFEYVKTVMRIVGESGVPNVIFSATDKEVPIKPKL
jgi:biopolymer transport protein ExbD